MPARNISALRIMHQFYETLLNLSRKEILFWKYKQDIPLEHRKIILCHCTVTLHMVAGPDFLSRLVSVY